VRHVLNENQRVHAAVHALKRADLAAFGELLYASHESLRRDFEVSIPEIDLLVELARHEPAILGARLTGGGFGGAVVMAASGGAVDAARRVAHAYRRRSGRGPTILLPPLPAEEQDLHPLEEAFLR
jgi:galactokinase